MGLKQTKDELNQMSAILGQLRRFGTLNKEDAPLVYKYLAGVLYLRDEAAPFEELTVCEYCGEEMLNKFECCGETHFKEILVDGHGDDIESDRDNKDAVLAFELFESFLKNNVK